MYKFTIPLAPRTKKNSQIKTKSGKIIPSKAFTDFQEKAIWYIPFKWLLIDFPVNIKYTFYADTRRKVDGANLISAMDDILTSCGVIRDDNRDVIAGHDGTRVFWDNDKPRVEVEITRMEGYEQWGK